MTGGKQENRVSMMTQIMSKDQLFGAETFTPWLPLQGHDVKEANHTTAGTSRKYEPWDSAPVQPWTLCPPSLTLQFVLRHPPLQQGEVTDDVLQKDHLGRLQEGAVVGGGTPTVQQMLL